MFSFVMLLTCKIFNSSDDALLARAKLQSFDKKTWISQLDLYLIASD